MRFMKIVTVFLLGLARSVLGLALIALVAVINTGFMWLGWNHGVVPALFFTREINVFQAFCLSLCFAGVAAMFRATLAIKPKDQP
jgi:hypothetical protein